MAPHQTHGAPPLQVAPAQPPQTTTEIQSSWRRPRQGMRRLLLIEDDPRVSTPLREALTHGAVPTLVRLCETGREALAVARHERFDVVLVDLTLPDMPGDELLGKLRRSSPTLVTLAFGVHEEPSAVLSALRAGARGFLVKAAPTAHLEAALAQAIAGGAPLSAAAAAHVVEALRQESEAPALLSSREREVLSLLARGLTYPAIAKVLGIGLGTVQTYVKHLYAKLDVSTKAEATAIAVRAGLLG